MENYVTKIKENIDTIFINNQEYKIDVKEYHSNGIIFVEAFANGLKVFACQTKSKNYWIGDEKTWSMKLDVIQNLAYLNNLPEQDFYELIRKYGYSINDMYAPYIPTYFK